MAIIRSTSSQKRVGRVGSDSYYVRDGKQVVRQALNNSNYGESASRTEAQQRRRVRWANLVNVYKSMKAWQPKAYESKKQGQTDYNIFMSVNINTATAALTKDMALNGCAVMEGFQVSRGSLPTIQLNAGSVAGDVVSDIVITQAITESMTVGQLSQMIIENNPVFQNGDNIALPAWAQMVDGIGYPYLLCGYQELTLNVESTVSMGDSEFFRFISSTATNYLTIRVPGSSFGRYVAVALIHTRKSGQLLTSSQSAIMLNVTTLAQFSNDSFVQQAIDSYGIDSSVPLDPGDGDGNSSQASTVYSSTLTGLGESVSFGSRVRMKAGTYRLSVSPAAFGIAEDTPDTTSIVAINAFDENLQNNTPQYFTASSYDPTTGLSSQTFTVTDSNPIIQIGLRMVEGNIATVSAVRI